MAELLLFNIIDEEKRTAIRLMSVRLGFSFRDISRNHQHLKIHEILAKTEREVAQEIPFEDEMMIMHGFPSADLNMLLQHMRAGCGPVKLKCVVTETNKNWTAKQLHDELVREEQAMSRLKQHVHKKRRK